jgi:transposase-like protein
MAEDHERNLWRAADQSLGHVARPDGEDADLTIDVPRDRNGSFEPVIVPKGHRESVT